MDQGGGRGRAAEEYRRRARHIARERAEKLRQGYAPAGCTSPRRTALF